MTSDEGYVKYQSLWTPGPAADRATATVLDTWRQPLFDAGLIGHDRELGVGFGNLSVRSTGAGRFFISGTQTGHLRKTDDSHYALVNDFDIDANTVSSVGPVQASSEALTHAAIYGLEAGIDAIVHVHSRKLWQQFLFDLPTTSVEVAYGTPQMAREFRRLYEETAFRTLGLAVMAGHDDGLVSFGASLEQATTRMLDLAGRD